MTISALDQYATERRKTERYYPPFFACGTARGEPPTRIRAKVEDIRNRPRPDHLEILTDDRSEAEGRVRFRDQRNLACISW